MSLKCVHKGCGKTFTDENEPCTYHPGAPIFHEGQKGWRCCKPRVLTFDEFLEIPPCTTGKHSTIDDTPAPEPKSGAETDSSNLPAAKPISNGGVLEANLPAPPPRLPQSDPSQFRPPASPQPPESDSDEPTEDIPAGLTCKRRGCDAISTGTSSRDDEQCLYHPGQALFHEGSKGWTCCKKRVLEFDEFMKIPGCKTRSRHCFVGKKTRNNGGAGNSRGTEKLETVRHDFYQTHSTVHASLYLKKIDKSKSTVEFPGDGSSVTLDLHTSDGKIYAATVPLYGHIDADKSTFRILGTKLDLTLEKADGAGWPVFRSDEKPTGEIIQTGRAGRA